MKPARIAVLAVLGLVVAVLALAGVLYATDYGVGGTVRQRSRDDDNRPFIVVAGDVLGVWPVETKRFLAEQQWGCLREGNFILYNIRSERLRVFEDRGGDLLYDSASPAIPAACLQGPDGGGGGFPFLAASSFARPIPR